MKKNYFILLLTLCFCTVSFGQVFITELADPNDNANARYIELYNAGDTSVDLNNWRIDKYTNASATVSQSLTLTGTIASKGFYIIATGPEDLEIFNTWGVTPDQWDPALNHVAGSNGDDNLELYDPTSTLIDQFGVPGEDGTGTNHEFEDGRAERKANVTSANSTWDVNEWTIDNDGGAGDGPINVAGFDPGVWIGTSTTTDPTMAFTSPSDNQVFPSGTTSISITPNIQNFTLSGDNGSEMTDNTGDGYIFASLTRDGVLEGSQSIFSGTIVDIENAVDGETYVISAELLDNAGNSLSPKVEATVTFSVDLPCDLVFGDIAKNCDAFTSGSDTYSIDIPFTMGNTSTYTLTTDFGTIAGDNPSSMASGTIKIISIPEGTDVVFNTKGGATDSSCDITRNVSSPTCVPAPTCPAVGSLIITEIMQNPSAVGDSVGEYFEIYNTSNTAIELQGWVIKSLTTDSKDHIIANSLMVPSNGYVVLGKSTDVSINGNVTVDYAYSSNVFLGNGSDSIALECGTTIIDSVSWDGGTEFPDPAGKSMELATNKYTAIDNDSGANWAEATAEINTGGDLGTPGTANSFVLKVERNAIEGFATYPNPITNNEFTISSSNSSVKEIVIFNVLGKKVLTTSFSGAKSTIDVSTINSGVYILKVTEEGKTATKKLVIR